MRCGYVSKRTYDHICEGCWHGRQRREWKRTCNFHWCGSFATGRRVQSDILTFGSRAVVETLLEDATSFATRMLRLSVYGTEPQVLRELGA